MVGLVAPGLLEEQAHAPMVLAVEDAPAFPGQMQMPKTPLRWSLPTLALVCSHNSSSFTLGRQAAAASVIRWHSGGTNIGQAVDRLRGLCVLLQLWVDGLGPDREAERARSANSRPVKQSIHRAMPGDGRTLPWRTIGRQEWFALSGGPRSRNLTEVPKSLVCDDPDALTLPRACAELNHRYGLGLPAHRLYRLVMRGDVPAEYRRGRWYLAPAKLQTIAATVKAALADSPR